MAKKSVVITDGGDAQLVTPGATLDGVATIITPIEVPNIVTADDAADGIMNAAPDVQEHVVNAHTEKQAAAPIDNAGQTFDPKIHSSDATGKGILTEKGLWRRKRGAGKAPGSAKSTIGGKTVSNGSNTPDAKEQAAIACGRTLAQTTFLVGRALGGEEWNPQKAVDEKGTVVYDEEVMMTDAWTNYCRATNLSDVPPGVILCVALMSYAAPRFRMPETKRRAQSFKEWFVSKWVNWRVKRSMRKQARTDSHNTEV